MLARIAFMKRLIVRRACVQSRRQEASLGEAEAEERRM